MDRKDKIEWISQNLVPLIDSPYKDHSSVNPDDDHVKQVQEIIAETYLDEWRFGLSTLLKSVVPVMFLDILYPIPAEIYGLVLSMVGTWILLVETDLMGRFTIADESEYLTGATFGGEKRLNDKKAKQLAKTTVATNIGLVLLSLGFLIQIVASILFPDTGIIHFNLLA